jgi:hypothetical protein
VAKGATRLFQILVTEFVYQIWPIRCKWRIEDQQNPAKLLLEEAIRAKWRLAMNKRLRYDRIFTDTLVFGRKALRIDKVKNTWNQVIENLSDHEPEFPKDWVTNRGFLVGITGNKCPPGRNR